MRHSTNHLVLPAIENGPRGRTWTCTVWVTIRDLYIKATLGWKNKEAKSKISERDSNPYQRPYQGLCSIRLNYLRLFMYYRWRGRSWREDFALPEPPSSEIGTESENRTHPTRFGVSFASLGTFLRFENWYARWGTIPRPRVYETLALPLSYKRIENWYSWWGIEPMTSHL